MRLHTPADARGGGDDATRPAPCALTLRLYRKVRILHGMPHLWRYLRHLLRTPPGAPTVSASIAATAGAAIAARIPAGAAVAPSAAIDAAATAICLPWFCVRCWRLAVGICCGGFQLMGQRDPVHKRRGLLCMVGVASNKCKRRGYV
jgi:hypothetical protein